MRTKVKKKTTTTRKKNGTKQRKRKTKQTNTMSLVLAERGGETQFAN